jgi:hypothetical protein
MQLGVRTERRAVSENVEKASTKACAVAILAVEELSASIVVIFLELFIIFRITSPISESCSFNVLSRGNLGVVKWWTDFISA